jgi:hypothetical protein
MIVHAPQTATARGGVRPLLSHTESLFRRSLVLVLFEILLTTAITACGQRVSPTERTNIERYRSLTLYQECLRAVAYTRTTGFEYGELDNGPVKLILLSSIVQITMHKNPIWKTENHRTSIILNVFHVEPCKKSSLLLRTLRSKAATAD